LLPVPAGVRSTGPGRRVAPQGASGGPYHLTMFLRENEVGSKVAPHLERGWTMLDLGAGTGYISRWLKDRTGVRPTLTDVVAYHNRERSLPFITLSDPFSVPVP